VQCFIQLIGKIIKSISYLYIF